jgi:hypothetical protein
VNMAVGANVCVQQDTVAAAGHCTVVIWQREYEFVVPASLPAPKLQESVPGRVSNQQPVK